MGMAASQVRFLSLQNRKNTVGLNLMTLSNRKLALSRDMNRIANEYNDAMNMKTLKWSGDSGITYSDLSYETLMKPNDLNANLPYILTDAQGRVVLDDQDITLDGQNTGVSYRDLAMMISSYSGKDDQGKTSYNNLDNLTGLGTAVTGNDIKENKSDSHIVTDNKAISGAANELGYEIVSTASETGSNTLRYDLMAKLGLISDAEVQAITDLELSLYGPSRDPNAPSFPVGTLMGDYYLAEANLEAYKNLLNAGKFNFSLTNTNETYSKSMYSQDGTDEIDYVNKTGATNEVSFNGASSFLSKVNLNQKFDAATGLTSPLTNENDIISGNFSYEISDGKITYTAATTDLLSLVSGTALSNTKLDDNGYTTDAFDPCSTYKYWTDDNKVQRNVEGQTWKSLYNSNAVVFLQEENRTTGIDQPVIEANLKAYINTFADDFQTGLETGGLSVDTAALTKAKNSTFSLFWGDILGYGFSNRSDNDQIGWRNSPSGGHDDDYNRVGSMNQAATNAALDHNLFGWATSDSGDDHHKVLLSVKNMINSFVSFYDFYTQTGRDQISTGDDISDMITIDSAPSADFENYVLQSSNSNQTIDGNKYIIETYKLDGSTDAYMRKYYLQTSSGTKGQLVQEDIYSDSENSFDRIMYDSSGSPIKYYKDSDDANIATTANDTKLSIGAHSSLQEYVPDTGSGSSGGSASIIGEPKDNNNSFTLTYEGSIDKVGGDNNKSFTIATSVASSNYATSVSLAFDESKLEELTKVRDDAKAAKDDAETEKAKYFDSTENKMMDYFDALFKMIAENGWVYDTKVNSGDTTASKNYLNAKLQNNMYFITEVDTLDGTDFNYSTKLASNVSKIFEVYDKDAQNAALSKYESQKAEINSKEQQIDVRMNKLEAEQDAISTELDSIKKIIDDNVSVTFKIFT